MRCPVDNETLVMADRGGVEIDYCPKCRGVWLDRGELDKIIERSLGGPGCRACAVPAARRSSNMWRPRPPPSISRSPAPRKYRDDDRRRYKRL
jgi:uncharacterized protein